STYWKVTLQANSTDGAEHRVQFLPHFSATLRDCSKPELEGKNGKLGQRFCGDGAQEAIGPEPRSLAYAFVTESMDLKDMFQLELCRSISDLKDLQVDIGQVDGISADVIKRREQLAFGALATPAPVSTVNVGVAAAPGVQAGSSSLGASSLVTPGLVAAQA